MSPTQKMPPLTIARVNALVPPERGEAWIADEKVKGFGIRLWATESGGCAAYAVRVRDRAGVVRRVTFSHKSTWRFRMAKERSLGDPQLGLFLADARTWAREQIALTKGRVGPHERRWRQVERARARIRALTVEQAAQQLQSDMDSRNVSQSFRDKFNKLFYVNVPREILDTPGW